MDINASPTTWVNTDIRKETPNEKESYEAEKYRFDESQSEKKTKYSFKNMKVAPRESLIEHLASKNCLEMLLTNAYSGIYNATAKIDVIIEEKEDETKIQRDLMEKEDSLTGNKHLLNVNHECLKSAMTSTEKEKVNCTENPVPSSFPLTTNAPNVKEQYRQATAFDYQEKVNNTEVNGLEVFDKKYVSNLTDHRARVQYYNALAKFVQTRAQIANARQRQINNDSERTQQGVIQLIYKRKLQENFSSKRNPSIQRDTVKKKRRKTNMRKSRRIPSNRWCMSSAQRSVLPNRSVKPNVKNITIASGDSFLHRCRHYHYGTEHYYEPCDSDGQKSTREGNGGARSKTGGDTSQGSGSGGSPAHTSGPGGSTGGGGNNGDPGDGNNGDKKRYRNNSGNSGRKRQHPQKDKEKTPDDTKKVAATKKPADSSGVHHAVHHGILPDGIQLDFAVGLLSNVSQSLLQSAVLRRDIQHIRRQFSTCFALIPTLSNQQQEQCGEYSVTECELCLCVELLLHHCTQCSKHWQECDQCFQLATIIKTHIQQCCFKIQRQLSEFGVDEPQVSKCKVLICNNIRAKLNDMSIRALEHFWKKPDIWDRIRSYLCAVFHAPELGHSECLLAFESLTSMSMMSDANSLLTMSERLTEEFEQHTWLGGAGPYTNDSTVSTTYLSSGRCLMTESYTDGATDPATATDHVTYGDVDMIRNMCDRWKDCGMKQHEGVILMEFKDLLQVHHGKYLKDSDWFSQVELGKGMFGSCFQGVDVHTGQKFCIKSMPLRNFDASEATIWSSLDHAYIARLYGVVGIEEHVFMFSQLSIGGSLSELIRKHQSLTIHSALIFCRQLFEALSYLQEQQIIHEDVKADNVVVSNSSRSILLIDFGMSRRLEPGQLCVPDGASPSGAQTHMSPEKASSTSYDYRSDVWANVCTLFHMLTGQPPWLKNHSDVGCLYYVIATRDPPLHDLPADIPRLYPEVYDLMRQGWKKQSERPTAKLCLKMPALQLADDSASSLWSMRQESELYSRASFQSADSTPPPVPLLAILQRTMSDVKTGQYSEERRSTKPSTRTYGSTSLTTEYTTNVSSTAYSSGEARVTTGKSGKDHMAHVQAQILRQPHLERWEAQEQDREQREQREYEERRRNQRQQQLLSQGGCRPTGHADVSLSLLPLGTEGSDVGRVESDVNRDWLNLMRPEDLSQLMEQPHLEATFGDHDSEDLQHTMDLDIKIDGVLVHLMTLDNKNEVCKIRVKSKAQTWYSILRLIMEKVEDFGINTRYTVLHNGTAVNLQEKPELEGEIYLNISTENRHINAAKWLILNRQYHNMGRK